MSWFLCSIGTVVSVTRCRMNPPIRQHKQDHFLWLLFRSWLMRRISLFESKTERFQRPLPAQSDLLSVRISWRPLDFRKQLSRFRESERERGDSLRDRQTHFYEVVRRSNNHVQESTLPNLFLRKMKIFFPFFLLLSLAISKYRQYYLVQHKHWSLTTKIWKMEKSNSVGLNPEQILKLIAQFCW